MQRTSPYLRPVCETSGELRAGVLGITNVPITATPILPSVFSPPTIIWHQHCDW